MTIGRTQPANPFYEANEKVKEWSDWLKGRAGEFLTMAVNTTAQLGAFHLEPVTFNVEYAVDIDPGTFARPTPPPDPSFDPIVAETVPALSQATIGEIDIGAVPPEPDFSGLQYRPPSDMSTTPPPEPGPIDVVLDSVDVGEFPGYEVPPEPEWVTIDLPDAPAVGLDSIDFDVDPPEFDIDVPGTSFAYTPVEYSSELLESVQAKLASMLLGGTGLPAAIEQALFDRARGREDMAAAKLVQEVTDEFATRGFSEPTGALRKRLREVRQGNQSAVLDHSRQVEIDAKKLEIEQLRFAVTQGIALEQVLIQQNIQWNDLQIRAAQIGEELVYRLIEAKVAAYNANLERFKTQALMVRERIQAELARVEVFKAQVQGESAKADINRSYAGAYEARVRALLGVVQAYEAEVNAARARAEVNRERVAAAKLQIEAYAERVRAFAASADAYRAQVEGRLGTVRAQEAMAQAYASRVQAFGSVSNVSIERTRAEIEGNRGLVEAYRANIDRVIADLRAQEAKVNAQSSEYSARARMYEAEGNISQAESAAKDRTSSMRIEAERARSSVAIEGERLRIEQARHMAEILLSALQTRSQSLAQLSASVLSGMNVSASISGNASQSDTWGTSHNYNYEGN